MAEQKDQRRRSQQGTADGEQKIRTTGVKTQRPDASPSHHSQNPAHPQDLVAGGLGLEEALVEIAHQRGGDAHMGVAGG